MLRTILAAVCLAAASVVAYPISGNLKLTTLETAMSAGVVRVAFMGDSITEGPTQIAYEDGYTGLLEAHLRREFDGISWIFGNFSISGRGIGEANSTTFVGANPENPGYTFFREPGPARTPPSSAALWPGGTVIGKSWRDHVKDFAPHILVIALGENTGPAGDDVAFKYTLEALIDYTATWTNPPEVVLVTPMTPAAGASPPTYVNAMAARVREVAAARGLAIADANALQNAKMAAGVPLSSFLAPGTVNHPNELCSRICYFAGFSAFLSSLKNPSSGAGVVAHGYSSNSTTPINSGDYIDVLINGSGAAAALTPGSNFFRKEVTGASATIVLRKSNVAGGTPVVVTQHAITFPHSGDWLVAAWASSTTSGAYKSHALMSMAWKR